MAGNAAAESRAARANLCVKLPHVLACARMREFSPAMSRPRSDRQKCDIRGENENKA